MLRLRMYIDETDMKQVLNLLNADTGIAFIIRAELGNGS
jgi:hypothetical protein